MRQPPFLLQTVLALLVEGARMGEQAFFPARQEHGAEFEALGGVQRHQARHVRRGRLGILHDEADMLEEGRHIVVFLEGGNEFLEVLELAVLLGRLVLLPHARVAALVQHGGGKLGVVRALDLGAPARKILDHAAHRVARGGLELVGRHQRFGGGEQRHVARARQALEKLHRRVADAPARLVDDALEGEVVVGLHDDTEIGDRVADLLALVEARAADHAIGDAQRDETFLELARLEARAHEDGDVAQLLARALQRLDLVGDEIGFLLAVPHRTHDHRLAARLGRPQRLAEARAVVRDEAGSGGEDVLARAVVLLEPHDLGAGKILLEAQDVADLGPAPAVDRLVVVAHAAQVARLLGEDAQPHILRDVGVLVFVDQHVTEALVVLGQHVGARLEDRQVVEQQVAEIAGVERLEARLVHRVELDRAAARDLARRVGADLVGREAAVLPAFDHAVDDARRPFLVVDVLGLQQLLDQPDLVVLVEDREIGLEAHMLGVPAQDARGECVEGAQPHRLDRVADDRGDAVAHLGRGLVGEGDREDLVGKGLARDHQVAHARDQHARLARPRPRQHQKRSLGRGDGIKLRRVEVGKIGRAGGRFGKRGHPRAV